MALSGKRERYTVDLLKHVALNRDCAYGAWQPIPTQDGTGTAYRLKGTYSCARAYVPHRCDKRRLHGGGGGHDGNCANLIVYVVVLILNSRAPATY